MAVKSVTITFHEGNPLSVVTRFAGDDEREIVRFGGSLASLVLLAEAMNEDAFKVFVTDEKDWDAIWKSEESMAATKLCQQACYEVVGRMLQNPSEKAVSVMGRALFRLAFREACGNSPLTKVAEYRYVGESGVRAIIVP